MPLTNSAFTTDLATATINLWLSKNYESLFLRNNAVAMKLRMDERIVTEGFGIQMVEPVMVPVPSSTEPSLVRVSDAYANITHAAMTGFTAATYDAAEHLLPVSVEEYHIDRQGSATTKINWVESVMRRALEMMFVAQEVDLWRQAENTDSVGNRQRLASLLTFFNAGSATTNGSTSEPQPLTQQVGIRGIVGATSANVVTTVGGLNRNQTNGGAYWATPTIITSQNLSVQTLSGLMSLTRRGSRKANLIICHTDVFDRLQGLASLQGSNGGQFFTDSRMARLGYNSISFQGAEVICDDRCPTVGYLTGTATTFGYQVFAVDTEFIALRVKSMKPTVRRTDDQRALWTWTLRWLGQLTASNLGRGHARHANMALA